MGDITKSHPKCITELLNKETILSRQLSILLSCGLKDIVITTGYYNEVLENYCNSLNNGLNIQFVNNPKYDSTNYIYSIYCARDLLKDDDILLLHGDLVFTEDVLKDIVSNDNSCMKVSSTIELPKKDFKAVVKDGLIKAVGIDYFDSALEAQALYKLNKKEWKMWSDKIEEYCLKGKTNCYAEDALNEILDECKIYAYDCKDRLCTEIDTIEDLNKVKELLK